jgi:hypothetical protein
MTDEERCYDIHGDNRTRIPHYHNGAIHREDGCVKLIVTNASGDYRREYILNDLGAKSLLDDLIFACYPDDTPRLYWP